MNVARPGQTRRAVRVALALADVLGRRLRGAGRRVGADLARVLAGDRVALRVVRRRHARRARVRLDRICDRLPDDA